jgi:hypothetical protein
MDVSFLGALISAFANNVDLATDRAAKCHTFCDWTSPKVRYTIEAVRRYTTTFFLAGVSSVLEVYPVPQRIVVHRFPQGLTDAQRLATDWYRVGQSLYASIGKIGVEEQKQLTAR